MRKHCVMCGEEAQVLHTSRCESCEVQTQKWIERGMSASSPRRGVEFQYWRLLRDIVMSEEVDDAK